MRTTFAVFGLMAASAMAAPNTMARRNRHQRRAERGRQSKPLVSANAPANITVFGDDQVQTTEYSNNWAGAVLVSTGFTGVTGTFTVPTVAEPKGGSSSTAYSGSAWVGIDGDTCQTAILQTEMDFTIQNGETTYAAWYEWYPDYAYDFTGITFAAGDIVKVTVEASSDTSGTAYVENVSTGVTVSHTFSDQTEGSLCMENAEWIVEDYEEDDELVALVNFGAVTFSSAYATQSSKTTVGPASATLIDMITTSGKSTTTEAVAKVTGTSEVIVTYE